MKKVPCPEVTAEAEAENRVVVRLEWGFFAVEMFDDEALRLAREIHDALEDRTVTEPWFATHRSKVDGSTARIIGTVPDRHGNISDTTFYFDNEDGLIFSDEIVDWEAIDYGDSTSAPSWFPAEDL